MEVFVYMDGAIGGASNAGAIGGASNAGAIGGA
jgi:hypothetical protein